MAEMKLNIRSYPGGYIINCPDINIYVDDTTIENAFRVFGGYIEDYLRTYGKATRLTKDSQEHYEKLQYYFGRQK